MSTENVSCEKEIKRMFRDVSKDLDESFSTDSGIFEQMGLVFPVATRLLRIIKELTPYYYNSYEDFFTVDERKQSQMLHSSTCIPFFSRLFLTSSGFIFPCEKVNFQYPLGRVQDSEIHMDFGYIANLYSSLFTCLQSLCSKCLHQFNCSHCFMQDGGYDGDTVRCGDFTMMNNKSIIGEIEFLKHNCDYLYLVYQ